MSLGENSLVAAYQGRGQLKSRPSGTRVVTRIFNVLFTFPLKSSLLFENASFPIAILLLISLWHLASVVITLVVGRRRREKQTKESARRDGAAAAWLLCGHMFLLYDPRPYVSIV